MKNNDQPFTDYVDEKLISSPDLLKVMSGVLSTGCHMRIRAKGGSMGPFIRNHDIITIATLTQSKLKLGEIVAFTNSKNENNFRLSMHRVVQLLDNENYLIKGDNTSKYPDGIVSRNQILGKVIKIERNNRIVQFGLGVERGFIAILSHHNLLVPLINWVRNITKFFRKGKRK